MHFLHQAITALSFASTFANFATAAPAKPSSGTDIEPENHHDWHECKKVKVTRELGKWSEAIPPTLPPTILSTLHCAAAPTGKHSDVHCGNVFEVAKTFCRQHSTPSNVFTPGNQTFLHEEYITDVRNSIHLIYMMRHHVDDFAITVRDVQRPCVDADVAWETRTPGVYERCLQSLWGVWTGCSANRGRGGEVVAGCLRYTLAVLD